MATYGVDYYGAAFYGGSSASSYSDDSFKAEARSYTALRLSWVNPPLNTWNYMRVMRSRAGFPTNVFEGDEVFYALSGQGRNPASVPVDPTWPQRQNVIEVADESNYLDTGLAGGWYYYSMFLHDTVRDRWERVGMTSAMVPFDYNSVDRIWSMIPEFYRVIQDSTAGYSVTLGQINPAIYLTRDRIADNMMLSKWVSVFGWGMDTIRSQTDSILDGSNPGRMHMNRLSLLAEQFGSSLETSVPAHYNRSLVRNLGLLYRQRGSLTGLEEQLRLATGWDVDVTMGPNMMLNKDQAEIASPVVPEWSADVPYQANDRVQRAGVYYRTPSATFGVQPPAAPWETASFAESLPLRLTTYMSKYGEISTWRRMIGAAGGVDPGKTWAGLGVPDPANVAVETNALETHNDGTTVLTGVTRFSLLSVPLEVGDTASSTSTQGKKNVIESGIPIPTPAPWDSSKVYEPGEIARYLGVPYQANTRTSSVPEGSTQWTQLGYDSRMLLGFTAFVHGPFNGVAGGGLAAKPMITFFDQYGAEMNARSFPDTTSHAGVVYDTFLGTKPLDLVANNGRTTPIGNVSYGTIAGSQWKVSRDVNGGFALPSGSALSYAAFAGAQANGWIAVTLRSIPDSPREVGLIVRRADASNYWSVTNKGIYKTVTGSRSTVQSWAAGTFEAGDRILVRFHSGGIEVQRRRGSTVTSLYSGTDTFNSATTNTHGVIAW